MLMLLKLAVGLDGPRLLVGLALKKAGAEEQGWIKGFRFKGEILGYER